jgi:hypothetical protein
MVGGQWSKNSKTMVNRRRSMVGKTIVSSQWSAVNGQWSKNSKTMVNRRQSMVGKTIVGSQWSNENI